MNPIDYSVENNDKRQGINRILCMIDTRFKSGTQKTPLPHLPQGQHYPYHQGDSDMDMLVTH